jgi:hypothetical protein
MFLLPAVGGEQEREYLFFPPVGEGQERGQLFFPPNGGDWGGLLYAIAAITQRQMKADPGCLPKYAFA